MNVGLYKEQDRQEFNQNGMCCYHMFSEASAGIFVFRARETPSCDSECVKMEFHVQGEEPETTILTVTSRIFDGCAPKFICDINNACKTSFLEDGGLCMPGELSIWFIMNRENES